MVCCGGEGTRSRFTIAGSMKVRTWDGVTKILCSLVVEHLVWTGTSQVVSSVYLLIVMAVVLVPVKWYNIVTGYD
jgi:hypothetical protein